MRYKRNKNAIELLRENLSEGRDNIDWSELSANPNAIKLLRENPENIEWDTYSANTNAITDLSTNLDKIDWYYLSINNNAIDILRENQDKIDWTYISTNPAIFTYDYKKIKHNFKKLEEEILAKALHPDRLFKLMEIYDENEVYNTYF